jgi:hypothetical protein
VSKNRFAKNLTKSSESGAPYTDKKRENFPHLRGNSEREQLQSYIRKGFFIYEEMRKFLVIYQEAVSFMYDFTTAPF